MEKNQSMQQDDMVEVYPADFGLTFMVTRPISNLLVETATGGEVEAQVLLLLIGALADKRRQDDDLNREWNDGGWVRMEPEWMDHSAMMFGCEAQDFVAALRNLVRRGFVADFKVDIATGQPNRFLLDLSGTILFLYEQLLTFCQIRGICPECGGVIDDHSDGHSLGSLARVARC